MVLIEPSHIATDMAQEQVGRVGSSWGRGVVQCSTRCGAMRKRCSVCQLMQAQREACQRLNSTPHSTYPVQLKTTCCAQEGTRYSKMEPGLMIQPDDVAQAALLAFRLSPAADPVELVLNRLQTPYET